MVEWDGIRSLFPALEQCVYLNTAAGAPMPLPAASAARRFYDEAYTHGDAFWDTWIERLEEVRRQVAGLIHAEPREIALLGNASTGLNLAGRMLVEDGEILCPEEEFPSVTLPWLQRRLPTRFLPVDDDGALDPDRVEAACRPDTACLAVSFVHYRSGYRHDLDALAELCRRRDLRLIVDGTQGVGAFPVDVRRTRIDAMVFSGYKWLAAGYGVAPLYVRGGVTGDLPAAGWRSARDPYALVWDRLEPAAEARSLELGHPPFAAIFALGGALELLDEVGPDRVTSRILRLARYLHERLDEIGVPVTSTRDPDHLSGIVAVDVPQPEDVAAALERRGVVVSARGRGLRLSVHHYNHRGDVDRLAEALVGILDDGDAP